jgi:hypothetical protein
MQSAQETALIEDGSYLVQHQCLILLDDILLSLFPSVLLLRDFFLDMKDKFMSFQSGFLKLNIHWGRRLSIPISYPNGINKINLKIHPNRLQT